MYSVTKWMLFVALIGANGDAIARAEAYDLDSVADDASCRPPFLCTPEVTPNIKGLLTNGTHTSPQGGSQGRAWSFHLFGDVNGAPRPVGDDKDINHVTEGRFVCGEVVSGYTVTCTTGPTRHSVSAPEIDAGLAVSGTMFVMGCLAILRGRHRRLADSPIGR